MLEEYLRGLGRQDIRIGCVFGYTAVWDCASSSLMRASRIPAAAGTQAELPLIGVLYKVSRRSKQARISSKLGRRNSEASTAAYWRIRHSESAHGKTYYYWRPRLGRAGCVCQVGSHLLDCMEISGEEPVTIEQDGRGMRKTEAGVGHPDLSCGALTACIAGALLGYMKGH